MAVLKIRNSGNDAWVEVGNAAPVTIHKGFVQRPKFEYKDADEVTVYPGQYHHDGTSEQYVYWDTTYDITVTATTSWNYLYLDDSAIASLGDTRLTSTCFTFSTTAPTYSLTKCGWYNSNDRCIFATLCQTSYVQVEFWNDGGNLVCYSKNILAASTSGSTWKDATLTIPGFAGRARMEHFLSYATNASWLYWRKNGSSAEGIYTCYVSSGSTTDSQTTDVFCDTNQVIEYKCSNAGPTPYIYSSGWYFPQGM